MLFYVESESDSLISSLKTKIREGQETARMHERREEGLENQLQVRHIFFICVCVYARSERSGFGDRITELTK